MFTVKIDDKTENLLITASNTGRAWLKEKLVESCGEDLIHEMLEPYLTNGSFEPFNAGDGNPFVGLSSAPCIAESITYDDDGMKIIDGRYWYYADYVIKDFAQDLKNKGRTVFNLAGD